MVRVRVCGCVNINEKGEWARVSVWTCGCVDMNVGRYDESKQVETVRERSQTSDKA